MTDSQWGKEIPARLKKTTQEDEKKKREKRSKYA
jgi:hypothetical protein